MTNESRPLVVMSGGDEIADGLRVRVRGSASMNLMPNCYYIDITGLNGYDQAKISTRIPISVYGEENGMLLAGELEDIHMHSEGSSRVTTLVVSDGATFWQTPVSMTMKSGSTVSQTMKILLKDVAPVIYNAPDIQILRAQTYSGRLADQISMLARSVGARAYMLNGMVQVTAKGWTKDIADFPMDDIVDYPGEANGVLSLSTIAKGYAVGRIYNVNGHAFRLIRQSYDLDNWNGNWRTDLTFLDEDVIKASEMGGG